jgi:hypothetical protein
MLIDYWVVIGRIRGGNDIFETSLNNVYVVVRIILEGRLLSQLDTIPSHFFETPYAT